MQKKIKVTHITTVHYRYDVRIFMKECQSLSKEYDTSLIVADGHGDENKSGVKIYDVGLRSSSRLKRSKESTVLAYNKALSFDSDIYHIHDPELLTIGLKLLRKNKKVIYDIHEDTQATILTKEWIPKPLRHIISQCFWMYEKHAVKKMSGIITATPHLKSKFDKLNRIITDINNYPILSELYDKSTDWTLKVKQACYVGGLTKIRSIFEISKAAKKIKNGKIVAAGKFDSTDLQKKIMNNSSSNIEFKGFLNRDNVKLLYNESMVGLVLFHPETNHIDSLPTKMFEYMSAGIPVIASNFPSWKKIIIDNHCGRCINPLDPNDITNAINYFLANPNKAEKMGKNGRRMIEIKYNWENESQKMLSLYQQIIQK